MGRVIGDGGTIFVIFDMLVIEQFQSKGGGTMIMNALMDYLLREAPPQSYINLMADVDGFYERWGFEPSLPNSRAMVLKNVNPSNSTTTVHPNSSGARRC